MPAKKRIARETRKLVALAYEDAVRDILRADGKFNLDDEESNDAVWEWDGVVWSRIPLVDRPVVVEPEEDRPVAG
ncbi:MAG TPA: hypothetical protein VF334_07655 [Polyangia bacterium]